jgi:hypothetical protein
MSPAANSYLFVVFLIIALMVDLLPFIAIIKKISELSRHSYQIIRATDLIDDKKQPLLLSNSLKILKESIKIWGLIIIIGVCFYLLLLISIIIKPLSFQILSNAILSITGLILSLIAFAFYVLLKKLYVKFRL